MSVHTRKLPTSAEQNILHIHHQGIHYCFPREIAERFQVEPEIEKLDVFADINKKYTRAGALLRGIRIRENLTQVQMAKKLLLTQSDISQIENGKRSVGKIIARRIEAEFDIDYHEFLG